jgi:hypothetical protein
MAGVQFLEGARHFSLLQTDSGANTVPCSMGTRALFLEVKQQGLEDVHSPPYSIEVKHRGAIPPLLHTSSCNFTILLYNIVADI